MIYIISNCIPDSWKTNSWLLWDGRETWFVCKKYYRNFQMAYQQLRCHEVIIALSHSMASRARSKQ